MALDLQSTDTKHSSSYSMTTDFLLDETFLTQLHPLQLQYEAGEQLKSYGSADAAKPSLPALEPGPASVCRAKALRTQKCSHPSHIAGEQPKGYGSTKAVTLCTQGRRVSVERKPYGYNKAISLLTSPRDQRRTLHQGRRVTDDKNSLDTKKAVSFYTISQPTDGTSLVSHFPHHFIPNEKSLLFYRSAGPIPIGPLHAVTVALPSGR
ncbi:hypothetical protein NPIL_5901 [Nephila pilipes]|uniref:Uncharacterized protein n=1 Tax=Nephila pilipes TaxID=299642 RepID=A0A8X6UME1_NEPPI|nr:hypothetical protein NPIL_5901 [Nephila pilipes]